MPKTLTLPPLEPETYQALRQCYEDTQEAETRLRYQMVLLAHQGHSVSQIAHKVLRSPDTVERVLHRFQTGGLAAVPRRWPPGRRRQVTPEWETALLRVIDLDPHSVGVASANWTTPLLAQYLAWKTGIRVSPETVRLYLHRHNYVCKRPTWTLKRKAETQEGWAGNA